MFFLGEKNRNLRLRKNNKSSINLRLRKKQQILHRHHHRCHHHHNAVTGSPWDGIISHCSYRPATSLFRILCSDQTFAEHTMLFNVFFFFAGRCPMPTTKFMYQVWGANGLRKETSTKAKKACTTRGDGSLWIIVVHIHLIMTVMLLRGGRGPHIESLPDVSCCR